MSPLSHKIRTRVLLFLIFLFVVLTPILIGYTKGYRLDDALGLIQTGGIYLHSDISNTQVYIDNEFVENNGAFLRNTLVQNLLPNRYYVVRVERDEYQNWTKVLHVQPNLVTEARILMIPKSFTWHIIKATSTISQDIEDINEGSTSTIATSREDVVTEVVNPEFIKRTELFEETRDQFAIDVATSTYEYIRGERFPTTTTVTVVEFPGWLTEAASSSRLFEKDMVKEREGIVTWLENGNIYAIWTRENDLPPYYFCTTRCKEQLAINWEDEIIRYAFFPNRNDVVVVLTKNGIYAVEFDDRSQRNIQTIIKEDDLGFRLQQDGTLTIFDGEVYRETTL